MEQILSLLNDILGGTDFQIIKTTALTGLSLRKIVLLNASVFTKLDSGTNDIHTLKNFESTEYPAGTIFTFTNYPITAITLSSGLAIGYK